MVFLVFGGIALYVFFRVPMPGAPPEAMLWVAIGFGVLGAGCGDARLDREG